MNGTIFYAEILSSEYSIEFDSVTNSLEEKTDYQRLFSANNYNQRIDETHNYDQHINKRGKILVNVSG